MLPRVPLLNEKDTGKDGTNSAAPVKAENGKSAAMPAAAAAVATPGLPSSKFKLEEILHDEV